MALLDSVKKPERRPRRIVLYGTHGIGKSTWAACAPKPVFIPTEDGIRNIDVPSFPLANHISDVFQAVGELASEPHEYETAIIDSADWFEKLAWKFICEQKNVQSVGEIGYDQSAQIMRELLSELSKLKTMVIVLAHCKFERIEPPSGESYEKYAPKLHEKFNGELQEWADEVLFCNYKVYTKSTDEGFGRKRNVAIGGDRVIYTTEKPSHYAKNRINGLPEELALSFADYWQYANPQAAKPF